MGLFGNNNVVGNVIINGKKVEVIKTDWADTFQLGEGVKGGGKFLIKSGAFTSEAMEAINGGSNKILEFNAGDYAAISVMYRDWLSNDLNLIRGISSNHFSLKRILADHIVFSEGVGKKPVATMMGDETAWLPTSFYSNNNKVDAKLKSELLNKGMSEGKINKYFESIGKEDSTSIASAISCGNQSEAIKNHMSKYDGILLGLNLEFKTGRKKGPSICYLNSAETVIEGPVSNDSFKISHLTVTDKKEGSKILEYSGDDYANDLPAPSPFNPDKNNEEALALSFISESVVKIKQLEKEGKVKNINLSLSENDVELNFTIPSAEVFYDFIKSSEISDNVTKYKKNLIIQLQSEKTVNNSVLNLLGKHPEQSALLQLDPDNLHLNVLQWDNEAKDFRISNIADWLTLDSEGMIRIQLVGHGVTKEGKTTLGGLDVVQLQQAIHPVLELLAKSGPHLKGLQISLVGCETLPAGGSLKQSLPAQLLQSIHHQFQQLELKDIALQLTGRELLLQVNNDGKKLVNIDGKWVSKEVANLLGKQHKTTLLMQEGQVVVQAKSKGDVLALIEGMQEIKAQLSSDDTAALKQINMGIQKDIRDLSKEEQRSLIKIQNEFVVKDLQENGALKTLRKLKNIFSWNGKYAEALKSMLAENPSLDSNWRPILPSVSGNDKEGYQIQFIHSESLEVQTIHTKNPIFSKLKSYTNIQEHFARGMAGVAALQLAYGWLTMLNPDNKDTSITLSHEMNELLKMHYAIGITQMVTGTIQTGTDIFLFARQALQAEKLAAVELSTAGKALGRLSTAMGAAGLLLNGASIVFDAIELSNLIKENKALIKRGEEPNDLTPAIVNISADSFSLAAGIISVIAGLAEIPVLGEVAMVAGTLVMPTMTIYNEIEVEKQLGKLSEYERKVGALFDSLVQSNYEGGAFSLDKKNGWLIPKPNIPISLIDLPNSQVTLRPLQMQTSSQKKSFHQKYIHAAFGVGAVFTVPVGEEPVKGDFFDISSKLKIEPIAKISDDEKKAGTLFLPSVAFSKLDYRYQKFSAGMEAAKSDSIDWPDILDKLTDDGKIIKEAVGDGRKGERYYLVDVKPIFEETDISVILDEVDHTIVMPLLLTDKGQQSESYGKLSYKLQGAGGKYLIQLANGANLSLQTDADSTGNSVWILNTHSLGSDVLRLLINGDLKIDDVTLDLTMKKGEQLYLLDRQDKMQKPYIYVEHSDFSYCKDSLIEQLNKMSIDYAVIDNYMGDKDKKAYYSLKNDCHYFLDKLDVIDSGDPSFIKIEWGGVLGDYAIFYDKIFNAVWLSNPPYGVKSFSLAGPDIIAHASAHINGIEIKDGVAYISQWQDGVGDMLYSLSSDGEMTLISINHGEPFLESRLLQNEYVFTSILFHGSRKEVFKPDGKTACTKGLFYPLMHELEMPMGEFAISHTSQWLEPSDGVPFLKPSNSDVKIARNLIIDMSSNDEKKWAQLGRPGLSIKIRMKDEVPPDLVFSGSLKINENETFYFFSVKQQAVYRQHGMGLQGEYAERITIKELQNASLYNNRLYATTTTGLTLCIDDDGANTLIAINKRWLLENKDWKAASKQFAHQVNAVMVTGIKGSDGKKPIAAVLVNGQLIIAPDEIMKPQFVALFDNRESSRAYWQDTNDGKIYSQVIVAGSKQATMLNDPAMRPSSESIYDGASFEATILNCEGHILFIASTGEVLSPDQNGNLILKAVNKNWRDQYEDTGFSSLLNSSKWSVEQTFELLSSNGVAEGCFVVSEKQKVLYPKHKINIGALRYIGKDPYDSSSYLFGYEEGVLYQVQPNGETLSEFKMNDIRIFDKVLSIVLSKESNKQSIPEIEGVSSLLILEEERGSNISVNISKSILDYYKHVIIDSSAYCIELSNLLLSELSLVKNGNDVIAIDPTSAHSIILLEALAGDEVRKDIKFIDKAGTHILTDYIDVFFENSVTLPEDISLEGAIVDKISKTDTSVDQPVKQVEDTQPFQHHKMHITAKYSMPIDVGSVQEKSEGFEITPHWFDSRQEDVNNKKYAQNILADYTNAYTEILKDIKYHKFIEAMSSMPSEHTIPDTSFNQRVVSTPSTILVSDLV
ncbi:TPA: TcdA/TcdB pore-forming domain-containing protein [Aeromonas hydrophila]